ncbi:P-loop containing nucleoside triphosphate hydrolase protein, partial [Hymenopellis radicata]
GVGKTSLCIRFVTDFFTEEYDAIQEDGFYRKRVSVDGEEVILFVLDTVSPVEQVTDREFLEADGFMLASSIDSPERMYEAMLRLQESIRKTLGNKDNLQFVTVGTKLDLEVRERVVQKEGKDLGCSYYEVSAKDGVNVNEPFFELVRSIRKVHYMIVLAVLILNVAQNRAPEVAVSRCFPKCCLM